MSPIYYTLHCIERRNVYMMISLDQKLGEPVSVIVNGCKVASGQLFVMDEQAERLGVKITEIFSSKEAI